MHLDSGVCKPAPETIGRAPCPHAKQALGLATKQVAGFMLETYARESWGNGSPWIWREWQSHGCVDVAFAMPVQQEASSSLQCMACYSRRQWCADREH